MISRRHLMARSLLAAPALLCRPMAAFGNESSAERLAALEREHGGRLGVCVLDTMTGARIEHRANELFAMSSTHKFLSAACVLSRVDRGEDKLERRVIYSKDTLVTYSPATEKHVDDGMTLSELCEAALTLSDNTAGNLLLDSFGGPPGLTRFAREIGDQVTRLDREETALNEAAPGDPRDTTSPEAITADIAKLVLGDGLSPDSRALLVSWLIANTTGDKRLRAGLPRGWGVGDKTGTGGNGQTNDIAVLWPPGRGAMIVAAFYGQTPAPMEQRERVLAEVGRLVAATGEK